MITVDEMPEERQGVIYGLCDPTVYGAPVRYVGLTVCGTSRRLVRHIKDARSGKGTHVARWIRRMLLAGERPVPVVLERVPPADLPGAEVRWIAKFKASGASLTNITDGGAHPLFPPETRARIRAALKGRKLSPAHIEHRSAAQRGLVRSEEYRAKLSAALKGRKASEETKALLLSYAKGRKQTAETIARRSASLRGHSTSAETRERIAAAQRGRPKSAETRERMRQAALRRWVAKRSSPVGKITEHQCDPRKPVLPQSPGERRGEVAA